MVVRLFGPEASVAPLVACEGASPAAAAAAATTAAAGFARDMSTLSPLLMLLILLLLLVGREAVRRWTRAGSGRYADEEASRGLSLDELRPVVPGREEDAAEG